MALLEGASGLLQNNSMADLLNNQFQSVYKREDFSYLPDTLKQHSQTILSYILAKMAQLFNKSGTIPIDWQIDLNINIFK